MADHPEALVFGEDVAVKGGVYGVTRGLQKRFGGRRVFDTLLDEQTILGVALGTALAGFVPIPEIQYLAYLHNAEDQLRGEAATLAFFSDGQYRNGMVVRVPGLAYQKGFGGHFHNDNSLAVLRDVPGLVLAVASHPAEAPGLLRGCFDLARREGRVCVFVEPIARYHTRDLLEDGDGGWTAPYDADGIAPLGSVVRHGDGSRRAPRHLRQRRPPEPPRGRDPGRARHRRHGARPALAGAAAGRGADRRVAGGFDAVLVVDETRRSGGVSEGVVATLVDHGYAGRLARVTSADSFVPLGPAAETVLLGEDEIVSAVRAMSALLRR